MPFVQGKCESCGGILTVDPSLKAANCPFCGTAYVVQDSINYYNTTIKVETMHANVVNVTDESSSEGRIKAGDALMKLGKYEKAELEYKKATELTPQNYKGWLGLIESHTHNYSKRIRFSSELRTLSDYSRSVKIFAPEESSDSIIQKFEEYRGGEIEKNTNEAAAYKNAIAEQTSALEQLNEQENQLTQNYNQTQQQINSLNSQLENNQKSNTIGVAVIWFIIQPIVGFVFLSINKVIGIILLVGAIIPALIFIVSGSKNNKLINERNRLVSEQKDIQNQINELKNQEIAYYTSIQANKREIEKYAL